MSAVAIIQARTGSNRLPKKVLKKISNITLIEWVIKRVKKSKKVNKIILATTKSKKDNILEKLAKKNRIKIFRGKEKDVLNRFYEAAVSQKANIVVRVCADNPFIDAFEIDKLIQVFKKGNYDYACNHQNKLNSKYADGFGAEVLHFDILKMMNNDAKKEKQREHVTKYIWDNSKKFKILSLSAPLNLAYPKLKFDINTSSDYFSINSFVKKYNININTKASRIVEYKLKQKKRINANG